MAKEMTVGFTVDDAGCLGGAEVGQAGCLVFFKVGVTLQDPPGTGHWPSR
jgi:hypothetical protein